MEKKKLQLIAVIAIFAILAIVVIYQVVNLKSAAPGAKKAAEESPLTYKERLLKAEMLIKRLPRYRVIVKKKQDILDGYLEEIPMASDPAWLSRHINRIASEVGVGEVSQKFRPGLSTGKSIPKELADLFGERAWELHLGTGYHKLGRFLNELEEMNPFLNVENIDIKGNTSGRHDISLLVRYLVIKENSGGRGG